MSENDLLNLLKHQKVSARRIKVAHWVESKPVQAAVIFLIIINAIVLGLETSPSAMQSFGILLKTIDRICLLGFVIELALKLYCYRLTFWRSGWNIFDFLVVGIALVPGSGTWAVLRSLRVLRVLRLLTAVPSLKKVVAAFIHSIPGLGGVIAVMTIFFYTTGVLATKLFGATEPEYFGDLGSSLYTLFQIMTLESWSMGIVRPTMENHPWAWLFFVPFIMIATFTILNLFIGIIVSTMSELALTPEIDTHTDPELVAILTRIDTDLKQLRSQIEKGQNSTNT